MQLSIEDYTEGRIATLPLTPRQFLADRDWRGGRIFPWLRSLGLTFRQAHVLLFQEDKVTLHGEDGENCQLLFEEGSLVDDGLVWWEDLVSIAVGDCRDLKELEDLFPHLWQGNIEVNADNAALVVDSGIDLSWAFYCGLLDEEEWVARGYIDASYGRDGDFKANEFHQPQL